MNDTFTCYWCHGTFKKGWTNEEALQELKENFGEEYKPEDCEMLCDDCYELFMKENKGDNQ